MLKHKENQPRDNKTYQYPNQPHKTEKAITSNTHCLHTKIKMSSPPCAFNGSFKEKQIKNNWFISSKSRCSKISSIRISFAISLIKFSLYGQKQCLCFNLTISSTLIYSLASNSHILYINNSFIKPVLKLDAD